MKIALAEAMRRILTDKRLKEEMWIKGLERARQFTWERAARGTLEMYHEVFEYQYLQ